MKLNCIAVDDEPLALGLISSFIRQTPFLNLVASHSSAVDAMNTLQQTQAQIQLIFLDIQMPKLNGIELARLIHQQNRQDQTRIIFTTAFNQFAVDSYRVDALDYLLKPFDYEDFLRAANKAVTFFELRNNTQQPVAEEEYLFVRVEYQLVKIAMNDILYIEGLKDYAKIHLASNSKAILTLMTLKSLEEKLPAHRFMRIQRSFIVALPQITAITKSSVRIGEAEITIGEQYKDKVQDFLSKWL